MLNLKKLPKNKAKYDMQVRINNFAKIGCATTEVAAIGEVITNAIPATGIPGYGIHRMITIDVIDGSKYPFTQDGERYLVVKNSGTPVANLARMMDNGYSTQEGDNHVFGMGHLYFLSKFAGDSQEYITYTKYDDHIAWISGPYVENPPYGEEDLSQWPFEEDWCVTATIVHIDDVEVDITQYEYELRKKFALALKNDPLLDIEFCGKRLTPVLPPANDATTVMRIVQSEELDAELRIYEFEAPFNEGSEEFQGITIFSCGVCINYFALQIIQKKSLHDRKIKWKYGKEYWMSKHPYTRRLATYVDIYPHKNCKFIFPYMSDKSDFDFSTSRGQILGTVIDNLTGDRFRYFEMMNSESEMRKDHDIFLEQVDDESVNGVLTRKYLTEVNVDAASSRARKKTKQFRIDAITIPVHDNNRKKVEDFLKSKRKRYTLSKEDFDGTSDTFKLREYKRAGQDLQIEHVSQLCDYADLLQLKYGIPKSQMQLQLHGTSIDEDTAQMLEFKKSYGHNITFVPYMHKTEN